MITSHETGHDYNYFYQSLKQVLYDLCVPFNIRFLMKDASLAERVGLHSIFPKVLIIICYFHVKNESLKNELLNN